METAANRSGASYTYRYNADDERVLKIAGSEELRTYAVNGLSEFSTEGGPITWTGDYLYIGSRLLGAVRPAPDPLSLAPVPVGSQGLGSCTYVNNSPLASVGPSGLWGFNIGFGGFEWGGRRAVVLGVRRRRILGRPLGLERRRVSQYYGLES